MKREDDIFYFLQCSTVASPGDEDWHTRVKEEKYAITKFREYLTFLEKNEFGKPWFELSPTSDEATTWLGKVYNSGYEFDIELVLKRAYPSIPPAVRIPVLIDYTDRKLEDPALGLRICDMHMEQNYWWDEHAGIALYLKREASYWLQSVMADVLRKGWLE